MITGKDVNLEIREINKSLEEVADVAGVNKLIVKTVVLVLKVLRDMRINQVKMMEKMGISLPEKRSSDRREKK